MSLQHEPVPEGNLPDTIHTFHTIEEMSDHIKAKYGLMDRIFIRGMVVNLGTEPIDLSYTETSGGIMSHVHRESEKEEVVIKPIHDLLASGTEFASKPGEAVGTRLIVLNPKDPTLHHAESALDQMAIKWRVDAADIPPSDEQKKQLRTALIIYNPQAVKRDTNYGTHGFLVQTGPSAIKDVLILDRS